MKKGPFEAISGALGLLIYPLGLLNLDFELARDKMRAMTVELGRTIDRLSVGWPLGASILRGVVQSLAEAGELPESLQGVRGENTARAISSTSEGPYLESGLMHNIAEYSAESGSVRSYAKKAVEEIAKHREDALCHLRLPRIIWNHLLRRGIDTISSLETYLYDHGNTLADLRSFGQHASDRVIQALNDFRIRLETAKSSTR